FNRYLEVQKLKKVAGRVGVGKVEVGKSSLFLYPDDEGFLPEFVARLSEEFGIERVYPDRIGLTLPSGGLERLTALILKTVEEKKEEAGKV
ncbi:MAG: hypothetical protein GXN94_02150, partial [Aquificae bacterium]|nr:hypothetical protein [Aquificota bacterium]